jgi:hypothetical protein
MIEIAGKASVMKQKNPVNSLLCIPPTTLEWNTLKIGSSNSQKIDE